MLELDSVSYQYPSEDFDIIDRLSFRIAPGSFHCILGVSGCGKSTIFRLTNGLLLLDEPFSAPDFLTRISMQEWLLDQWQRYGKTILFITHDVEEALFLSSSVLVVERTPIQTLAELPVPAPFPRERSCLKAPELADLKERLVALLRKQVKV